jgi:hypothetical protein
MLPEIFEKGDLSGTEATLLPLKKACRLSSE